MAEQPETAKVLDEIAKKNTAKPRGKAGVKAKSKSNSLVTTLIILTGVITLGALGFLAYQQRLSSAQFSALQSENDRLALTLQQQTSQLENLQQQLQQTLNQIQRPVATDNSATDQLRVEVESEISRIDSQLNTIESMQQSSTASPDFEWKIFEAEYLLGIANQKLQLESDVKAAIAMIEAADAALLGSGSSRVFAVRQAIANELTRLRSADFFDRQGVYLSIGALIEEVENIDLVNSMRENFESSKNQNSTPVRLESDSGGLVRDGLEFLSSVFVWRHWEESPNSMLAPEQGEFIRQNLKLMLEQSQLALLMKDQTVFTESLRKSSDWLKRYAVVDSNAGKTLADSLQALSVTNINPVLPGINESLALVRQLTAAER